jgi:hypothetical protein
MLIRTPAAVLVLAACAGEAAAQPVAPPRRPTFSSYSNLYSPGGGYYGYGAGGAGYGFNPYGYGAGAAQQAMVLQQLNQTNSAVANLQQFLAYGMNPVLAPTGRGATFNNLSHWYPTYRGQGVPFGASGGGFGVGAMPYRGGGLMNTALTGAATANAFGGGGGNAPRTSGNGIPVGGGAKR